MNEKNVKITSDNTESSSLSSHPTSEKLLDNLDKGLLLHLLDCLIREQELLTKFDSSPGAQ